MMSNPYIRKKKVKMEKVNEVSLVSDECVEIKAVAVAETVAEQGIRIFSIMGGTDEEEIYTDRLPQLLDNTAGDIDILITGNIFKKGIISQEVLGNNVEEYYKETIQVESINKNLRRGVIVKQEDIGRLTWLNVTAEQAVSKIKDKVILTYNQIVPNLFKQMEEMKAQITQTRAQGNGLMNL